MLKHEQSRSKPNYKARRAAIAFALVAAGVGVAKGVPNYLHNEMNQQTATNTNSVTREQILADLGPILLNEHREYAAQDGDGVDKVASKAFPSATGEQLDLIRQQIAEQTLGPDGGIRAGQAIELPENAMVGNLVGPVDPNKYVNGG